MALLRRLLPVVDGRFILLVRKPLDAGRGPLLREDNSPAPQIAGCDDIGADLGRRRRVRRATLVPTSESEGSPIRWISISFRGGLYARVAPFPPDGEAGRDPPTQLAEVASFIPVRHESPFLFHLLFKLRQKRIFSNTHCKFYFLPESSSHCIAVDFGKRRR